MEWKGLSCSLLLAHCTVFLPSAESVLACVRLSQWEKCSYIAAAVISVSLLRYTPYLICAMICIIFIPFVGNAIIVNFLYYLFHFLDFLVHSQIFLLVSIGPKWHNSHHITESPQFQNNTHSNEWAECTVNAITALTHTYMQYFYHNRRLSPQQLPSDPYTRFAVVYSRVHVYISQQFKIMHFN